MVQQHARFARRDQHDAIRRQQTLERADGALLRRAIEIDEEVAAEDRVIPRRAPPRHPAPAGCPAGTAPGGALCRRADARSRSHRSSVPGIPARGLETNSFHTSPARATAMACALISTASMEKRSAGDAGVEERHRNRVRLFTRRGREAEDAAHAVSMRRPATPPAPDEPMSRTPRDRGRTRSPERRRPRSAPGAQRATHTRAANTRRDRRRRTPTPARARPARPPTPPIEAASRPIDAFRRFAKSAKATLAPRAVRTTSGAARSGAWRCRHAAPCPACPGPPTPRYGARSLTTPESTNVHGLPADGLRRLFGDESEQRVPPVRRLPTG